MGKDEERFKSISMSLEREAKICKKRHVLAEGNPSFQRYLIMTVLNKHGFLCFH